jgi:diguanylate cyclase (GGDEF)-like protein/PAS domain S-box-containing protein
MLGSLGSPLGRKDQEPSDDARERFRRVGAPRGSVGGSRWLVESVVASWGDAVISRGLDGLIDVWNTGAERLYGYSADEAVGLAHEVIVPDRRRNSERELTTRALRGDVRGSQKNERLHKSGATIEVLTSISAIVDADGAPIGVSTVERRAGASWPSGVDAYLRSAFEDAPIGIALVGIDTDSAGRFLRVNRALCELTGYSPDELADSEVRAIVHPDDLTSDLAAMKSLVAGESTGFELEQRLIHADRHAIWVTAHGSLVRDASGSPLYCIRQVQDIEERKRFEGELGYLADHDPLTGLLNRRGFVRELTTQLGHARRYGGGGAVLFLDIDDFKYVNDTLGHSAGDEVISGVARVVGERLRDTDVFARLGGDEFAVLLPHATLTDARTLSLSVLEAVKEAHAVILLECGRRVTVSIGVSAFPAPAGDLAADDILVDADLAMYEAKEAGKDRIAVATAANLRRLRLRVPWAERVRSAVDGDLFELYCQPIVDLATDRISQWELLLRLPGDDDELILPAQFLYTAERSGLILTIDRWVLSNAIRLISEHQHAGRQLRLEINLSGRSVGDHELPGFIARALSAARVDPAQLVLEITETAAIANMDNARKFAAKLTEIGCRFALDDFGAGFGSFYYLKHLPFDYVKIDGEFIRHLPASSIDQLILDSIVQMSKGLGKRTIAEFVSDENTIAVLKEHGVDYAQGYHLGRPRPVTDALTS